MPGMALQEDIGAIALGDLRVTDETVDRLAKLLRRCSYFLAFLSFATFARWIKVPRSDLPIYNVASEGNAWTWFNVTVIALAATAMLLTALARRSAGLPALGWFMTAAVLYLLSLDDLAGIHERFGALGEALGGGAGFLHFAWVIPGFLAAAAVIGVFWTAFRDAAPPVRRAFLLGIGLFFFGALVLEMIGGAVYEASGHRRPYAYVYHLEEILEAVGMIFVLSAGLKDLIRVSATA